MLHIVPEADASSAFFSYHKILFPYIRLPKSGNIDFWSSGNQNFKLISQLPIKIRVSKGH